MNPVSKLVRLLPGELRHLSLLDPRLIVELTVAPNQEIEVVELNTVSPLKLNKKILIPLPANTRQDGIKIRSIQFLSSTGNPFVLIETNGPLTPYVKQVAEKIVKTMNYFGITRAFFPGNVFEAYKGEEATLFFFGRDINKLQRVSCGAENIRILDEKFIMFCHKKKIVKKMRIMDMQYDWIVGSFSLWRASEDILFIGRPKKDSIPITLQNGRVAGVDVYTGQVIREEEVNGAEKMAACIGEALSGVNIVGITQQNQLLLSPPSI